MDNAEAHRIATVEDLRAILGDPGSLVRLKLLQALDEMATDFIQRAPFLVIATADAEGNQDASPKGDGPGFVLIEDANTLYIPDRRGNKLLFGLENILANPHVGLIFMVPGTNETLRVNGIAELTADPMVLERLSARGTPAVIAIKVSVRECFFHCAKAFIRSALWQPETWQPRVPISFGKYLAAKVKDGDPTGKAEMARKIDVAVEQDYKNNL